MYIVEKLDDMTTRTSKCSITHEVYKVSVPTEEYKLWRLGEKIQNVWPKMSADDREFLISGLTPAEFESLFPADDVDMPYGQDTTT